MARTLLTVGSRPVSGRCILLLTLALLVAPPALLAPLAPLYAQPQTPELTRPVNDFANVIDPADESELERRIVALKQATGDVVVVATVETFAPYADIDEYAVRMFENRGRGIGDKGKDNGLLVVVVVKDRRDRIEVGYDLEQFITDGFAGEVRRTEMAPRFARGEYGQGMLAGVTRLIARIAQGRGVTLEGIPQAPPERGPDIEISPWLILAIIIIILLMNSTGRRSRMRRGPTHWGAPTWSGWNSGVGPFGGGGRIGGGFGGGFGGFGGGRSGGGGASGGW
jgi:uncharacterized protein